MSQFHFRFVIERKLLLKLCLFSVLLLSSVVCAAPSIQCDHPVYDFGERPNTQTVGHSFVIRNSGDEPLELKDVRGCCGAAALADEKIVLPGFSTQIKVKTSLQGRRGLQTKKVTIKTNDPDQPVFLLRLTGTAMASVYPEPAFLNFDRISPGKQTDQTAQIRSEPPIRITKAVSTNPAFKVLGVPANNKARGNHVVTVRFTADKETLGVVKGFVRLSTDHPDYPMLSLPVVAYVGETLTVLPSEIILKPEEFDSDKPVMKMVIVRSFTGQPFKVIKAEVSGVNMPVKISPLSSLGYRVSWLSSHVDASWLDKTLVVTVEQAGEQTRLNVPFKAAP